MNYDSLFAPTGTEPVITLTRVAARAERRLELCERLLADLDNGRDEALIDRRYVVSRLKAALA